MGKSRKFALTDWTAANNALMHYFDGNKTKFAKYVNKSRTTVTDFFNKKLVGESSFRDICFALRLNMEEVSLVDHVPDSLSEKPIDLAESDLNLIEKVREHCCQKIMEQHSKMRLLSGEEIEVKQLYVDVWVLEKPERSHFNTPKSLLENFDIENDRLALSKRIKRKPGLKIAKKNSKLFILGKPGSGKTTFLKNIAINWCNGEFKPDLILVLVEIRKIKSKLWDIWSEVGQELGLEDWYQFATLKRKIKDLSLRMRNSPTKDEAKTFKQQIDDLDEQMRCLPQHILFSQGKFLILVDGLDESDTHELRDAIYKQIQEVSLDYPNNHFICTCRTQVISLFPKDFVLVEVADFKLEQIRQFFLNWFTTRVQSEIEVDELWKTFHSAIDNQPDLRELTVTPVLLSLMCLVFHDEKGEMPTDRSWLYRKGLKLLLNRWNNEKEINAWEVGTKAYRQLRIEDKESLLIEIAAHKFENPKNFILFEQNELAEKISRKLQLAGTQEGVAVLKAIEAHHGLLIERADELWSFSHLTFQEYFTVEWLTRLPPQQLAEKISNLQWQKVIEQLVKSQQPADSLLRLIKKAIDQFIAQESVIQTFLGWLLQKSNFSKGKYQSSAIRAFYFSLVLDIDPAFDDAYLHNQSCALSRHLNRSLALTLALDHDRTLVRALDRMSFLDRSLSRSIDPTLALHVASDDFLAANHALAIAIDYALTLNRSPAPDLLHSLACHLTYTISLDLSPALISYLRQLKSELLTSSSFQEFLCWWSSHGGQWIEQLRQVMTQYLNIGHDWQFTYDQQQFLSCYHQINNFLTVIMGIEGAVSNDCRTEIEEGLLLPWSELQHRQPHLYAELPT